MDKDREESASSFPGDYYKRYQVSSKVPACLQDEIRQKPGAASSDAGRGWGKLIRCFSRSPRVLPQGSSQTHKTEDFEPRTAPFSGAAYNALLPCSPGFPTGMAMYCLPSTM
jgi:hypothetical protein